MNPDKKFVIRCRAIILRDNKLLLVRHPHDTSVAVLPGGHLEWGEGIKQCLQREIIEELGVEPEIGKLLYVNTFEEKGSVQPIEFFFEVTNVNDYIDCESLVRTHSYELTEIIWANPTDDIRILPKQVGEDFKKGTLVANEIRYLKGDGVDADALANEAMDRR